MITLGNVIDILRRIKITNGRGPRVIFEILRFILFGAIGSGIIILVVKYLPIVALVFAIIFGIVVLLCYAVFFCTFIGLPLLMLIDWLCEGRILKGWPGND